MQSGDWIINTMHWTAILSVWTAVFTLSSAQETCMDFSDFRLLEYSGESLYASGSSCVCRYNMNLTIEVCSGNISRKESKFDAVLLADRSIDRLIVCGTNLSPCEMKDLQNLTTLTNFSNNEVNRSVAGSNLYGTIAFTSWGEMGDKNETVLYIATYANNNITSPISVRSLNGTNAFQLFDNKVPGSKLDYRENFHPVGGFSFNGSAYFAANQIEYACENSNVAKLIQICQNDKGTGSWLSYRDVNMQCANSRNVKFAMLLPAGKSFDNTRSTARLIAVYHSFNGTNIVCLYSFQQIRESYRHANPLQMNSEANNSVCNQKGKENCNNNNNQTCKNYISDNNSYLNNSHFVHDSSSPITAMTTSVINNHTIPVFLIASNRTVELYYIGGENNQKAKLIRNLTAPEEVRQIKVVDGIVYILTENNITKLELYNKSLCGCYDTYFDCTRQSDPFCGWCQGDARCTLSRECASSPWLSILDEPRNGSIENVSPEKGPVSGGTLITLKGTNLDLYGDIQILVGNMSCSTSNSTMRNTSAITCLTPKRLQPENVTITFRTSSSSIESPLLPFEYLEDPTVSGLSPNRTFASGGRKLTVSGSNFHSIQNPKIQIVNGKISEVCYKTANNSVIICKAPAATRELNAILEGNGKRKRNADRRNCGQEEIQCVDVEFQMDGVNTSLLRQTLEFTMDPVFYNFSEKDMTKQYSTDSREIVIKGNRINMSASAVDFKVTVGNKDCHVLSSKVLRYELHCLPPSYKDNVTKVLKQSLNPEVRVRLGNIDRYVGFLHYLPPKEEHYLYLYIIVGLLCVVVASLVILGVLLRRRNRLAVKKLQSDMQEMELKIRTEFRQAFADLQTDMTDITGELVETGLPYNKFPVYAFQILFPADDVRTMTSHKVFTYPETTHDVTDVDTAMSELDELFHNKFFVLSVIDTLEKQKTLSILEKVTFAGYLGAGLIEELNFFTQITKGLLKQYITDVVLKKKQKGLFKRYESITEKLTGIWMGVCLYHHFFKNRGGSSLIMLVKAIQTVMLKSPIDAVTDAARATLSYEQLLLAHVDNDNPISLKVIINGGKHECTCTVLGCDTIAQVKDKCLSVMYKKDAASKRPTRDDVDLEWHRAKQGRLILKEQETLPEEESSVKLMTLADYNVTDGSVIELLNKNSKKDEEEEYMNYKQTQNDQTVLSQSEVCLIMDEDEDEDIKQESDQRDPPAGIYHLIKPEDESQDKFKVLPEVHLHKLLKTKLNVKQYVDEAIDSALDRKDIPVVVKFIFSILEDLGSSVGVDQDTILSWKNNCYPIRFWGLLISRPNIVFDIDVPDYLQPSLDIVASTFMDSFTPPQTLSKNSAPHKLLFFKDLEEYRSMVKSFHRAVYNTPVVDDRQLAQELTQLTNTQSLTVNRTSVCYELYQVMVKYRDEILDGLQEDIEANRLKLSDKLEHVFELMDS